MSMQVYTIDHRLEIDGTNGYLYISRNRISNISEQRFYLTMVTTSTLDTYAAIRPFGSNSVFTESDFTTGTLRSSATDSDKITMPTVPNAANRSRSTAIWSPEALTGIVQLDSQSGLMGRYLGNNLQRTPLTVNGVEGYYYWFQPPPYRNCHIRCNLLSAAVNSEDRHGRSD